MSGLQAEYSSVNLIFYLELMGDFMTKEAGEKVRREVMGDEFVDRALHNVDELTAPLQEYINAMHGDRHGNVMTWIERLAAL